MYTISNTHSNQIRGVSSRWVAMGALIAVGIVVMTSKLAGSHAQTPTPEIYTCVDASGRKLTSDRPIAACRDREQKILNPSGTLKARVGPTLTAKELSLLEAKNKIEQAERTRLDEEKRQDKALLIRYPTQASHQKERTEALAHIGRVKQTAATRLDELLAQKARLTDEMVFYKANPSKAPVKLPRQIGEVNQSIAAQERFMTEQDAEASRINSRFDAELVRLIPLWRMVANQHQ